MRALSSHALFRRLVDEVISLQALNGIMPETRISSWLSEKIPEFFGEPLVQTIAGAIGRGEFAVGMNLAFRQMVLLHVVLNQSG